MPRRRVPANDPPAGRSARRRIVAAARGHFFAHGFRGVTMDDLAAELGMSKKTLYAHFRSKTELVEAAILDKLGGLESELEHIEAECAADFPEALQRLLACVQRHTEEIQPPFLRDIQRETPELFQTVQTRRAALIQRHFGKLFAGGRRAGMVRKDIPAALVTEILLGAVQAVMNPRKLGELGLAPEAAFSGTISAILDGVLTVSGRAKR